MNNERENINETPSSVFGSSAEMVKPAENVQNNTVSAPSANEVFGAQTVQPEVKPAPVVPEPAVSPAPAVSEPTINPAPAVEPAPTVAEPAIETPVPAAEPTTEPEVKPVSESVVTPEQNTEVKEEKTKSSSKTVMFVLMLVIIIVVFIVLLPVIRNLIG